MGLHSEPLSFKISGISEPLDPFLNNPLMWHSPCSTQQTVAMEGIDSIKDVDEAADLRERNRLPEMAIVR
jgi:hypothetical protein